MRKHQVSGRFALLKSEIGGIGESDARLLFNTALDIS